MIAKNLFPSLFTVIVAVSVMFLGGCGNASQSLYPEFINQKNLIQKNTLLSDYVVIEGTLGDINIINVPGNKTVAVELMNRFSDLMNEKGYHIENRILSSIGLVMDRKNSAKVIYSPEDEQRDIEELTLQVPPYFVYQSFARDSALVRALSELYNALINVTKLEGMSNPIVPEAIVLGKSFGGGTLTVLLTGGYNVPAGKELGMQTPSGSNTLGKVTTHSISQVTLMVYIVNLETGELLWSDSRHEVGGTVHKARILRIAEKISDNLP
jgi:hypothetical protein